MLALGQGCSSSSDCSSGVCIPVGGGAGCAGSLFQPCCLTVNLGGTVTGANDAPPCQFELCSQPTGDCYSGTCQNFLNGTGICISTPLGGGVYDGAGPDFSTNVCSRTCTTSADCVAGWLCGPQGGDAGTACQCSASYEVCDVKDNDCNGTVDDEPQTDRWCVVYSGPGHICQGGQCTCVLTCDGQCVDPKTNASNCGACGKQCPSGASCVAGTCECPSGEAPCNGACVNEQTDPNNCSNCGIVCDAGCGSGACASATAIAVGGDFVCALLSGGQVQCKGNNLYGQLGNGSTAPSSTWEMVSGLSGATAIAAGYDYACAIVAGGMAKCWGHYGTGAGAGTGSTSPVAVPGLSGASALSLNQGAAPNNATCAVVGGVVEVLGRILDRANSRGGGVRTRLGCRHRQWHLRPAQRRNGSVQPQRRDVERRLRDLRRDEHQQRRLVCIRLRSRRRGTRPMLGRRQLSRAGVRPHHVSFACWHRDRNR